LSLSIIYNICINIQCINVNVALFFQIACCYFNYWLLVCINISRISCRCYYYVLISLITILLILSILSEIIYIYISFLLSDINERSTIHSILEYLSNKIYRKSRNFILLLYNRKYSFIRWIITAIINMRDYSADNISHELLVFTFCPRCWRRRKLLIPMLYPLETFRCFHSLEKNIDYSEKSSEYKLSICPSSDELYNMKLTTWALNSESSCFAKTHRHM